MKLNVLIVDDSLTMRAILRKLLLLSGLPVGQFVEAGNGREGLQVLKQRWIDLILLDLNMPVMNGLEMIACIRARPEWSNIPVIVVSSESSQSRIEQITASGIHFIHKPFKPEHVRGIFEQYWELTAAHATEKLLRDVAQEVFENLVFMTIAPPEENSAQSGQTRWVQVAFGGPFSGTMFLGMTQDLVPELTADMLGVEAKALNVEQQKDALAELANIICGNLLARLAGSKPVFEMSAPMMMSTNIQGARPEGNGQQTAVRLCLERGWVDLQLNLNTALPREIEAESSGAC
ncbi:response regulator [candidate division FCPU426 bacterium]|nr:response regulator [candidate division FCPU426 bacterium]